jgi:hypothetical protein
VYVTFLESDHLNPKIKKGEQGENIRIILQKYEWELNGTGKELCSTVGFCVNGAESWKY